MNKPVERFKERQSNQKYNQIEYLTAKYWQYLTKLSDKEVQHLVNFNEFVIIR